MLGVASVTRPASGQRVPPGEGTTGSPLEVAEVHYPGHARRGRPRQADGPGVDQQELHVGTGGDMFTHQEQVRGVEARVQRDRDGDTPLKRE